VFPAELGRFIYWVPVLELLKIFAQNLHIYHRNDSTSACIIHFIILFILLFYLHISLWRCNWLSV